MTFSARSFALGAQELSVDAGALDRPRLALAPVPREEALRRRAHDRDRPDGAGEHAAAPRAARGSRTRARGRARSASAACVPRELPGEVDLVAVACLDETDHGTDPRLERVAVEARVGDAERHDRHRLPWHGRAGARARCARDGRALQPGALGIDHQAGVVPGEDEVGERGVRVEHRSDALDRPAEVVGQVSRPPPGRERAPGRRTQLRRRPRPPRKAPRSRWSRTPAGRSPGTRPPRRWAARTDRVGEPGEAGPRWRRVRPSDGGSDPIARKGRRATHR